MKISNHIDYRTILLILCCTVGLTACKSFIEVDPPVTSTNAGNVYKSDATTATVLTGIYSTLAADENLNIGIGGVNIAPSLSADELTIVNGNLQADIIGYYKNALTSNISSAGLSEFWNRFYAIIFRSNSAIEGISTSEQLTEKVKAQVLGEAYFIRAFMYFYLVNLYGDVPLVLTTNYKVNATMPRSSTDQVYTQMKDDLVKAQSLLSIEYLDGTLLKSTSIRVRPNKAVAMALLSRVYLYTNDWQNAEIQASQIIANSGTYRLETLTNVFLSESMESIWALQPTGTGVNSNTGTGRIFVLPSSGPSPAFNPYYLNDDLVKSFDKSDLRATNWINNMTALGITFPYAYKYKIGSVQSASLEYPVIFRLAEQYLIRAEARAQQNKLTGANSAQADLDVIRTRAGLGGTTATTQADLLSAILTERRHELFTEFGHRWFDLRRTGTIDAVMIPATTRKGGTWTSDAALYPIPLNEIQKNPKLVQNKGY
jgi:hypothetical protein